MSEIEEVERLINESKYPGLTDCLRCYLSKIQPTVVDSTPAMEVEESRPAETSAAIAQAPVQTFQPKPTKAVAIGTFIPITDYLFDQGAYNAPTLSIIIELPNVGAAKDRVECNFGTSSFDVKIMDLDGKNYRLIKDNLEKDIVPDKCSFIVKKNKLTLKLQKVKGEYSYESWTSLTAKKPRDAAKEAAKKSDPSAGLMDMMKDMYDDGDENMKKIIGEAMMKNRDGKSAPPGADI